MSDPVKLSSVITALCCISLLIPSAQAAIECDELARLILPDTGVTATEQVVTGGFTPPGSDATLAVPKLCRIAGTIAPAIRFEVWLPDIKNWNGRFQAVGGGGLAGIISYAAMARAVGDGYATASTDTGHEASDASWLGDRQRLIDYGYRAIHEMTVKARAIIEAYYGRAPAYSYFNGCSTGGRQGLMEAQRFPEDYDGIVAGAPVNYFTRLHIGQLWTAHATLKRAGAVLTHKDLDLISRAVMAQCDRLDGIEDGILADPRMCAFNPDLLKCGTSSYGGCLDAARIEALGMIYNGAVNPRTGVQIYPGLEPGGEAAQPDNPGWALLINGKHPFFISMAVIGGMAFEQPDYDWRNFDFDRDVELVDAKLFGVLNAVDPDLHDFKTHGGKLIVYHGWNDPGVMPQQTIDYYESVVDFAGKRGGSDAQHFTDEYLRLYMMPGVGHCRGGTGPDDADFMSAISAWVEKGDAPGTIRARKLMNGTVVMERPLCPYPQVAYYPGDGDPNHPDSFECRPPRATPH